MNALRNRLVVNAFRMFDRGGEGRATLDTLTDAFNAEFYANTIKRTTVKAVTNEFINWFVNKKVCSFAHFLQL